MNEHILELAKKAGVSAQSETTIHPNQVKFAELIVRECIDVVSQCNLVGVDPIAHIKVHFGVK
jgi:hypothetical protein